MSTNAHLGHGLAGDRGEHLCTHPRTETLTGCPRWPSCLPEDGIGLLRSGLITDDEAAAYAASRQRARAAWLATRTPRAAEPSPKFAERVFAAVRRTRAALLAPRRPR